MKEKYHSLTSDSYYFKNISVVIVHKKTDLIKSLMKALVKNKADVYHIEDSKEALNYCLRHKVDIILADMVLGDMDGIEFINKLRKLRRTPVIFLTNCTSFPLVSDAYNVGCADYLNEGKASLRDVLDAIKNTIRGRMKKDDMEWKEAVEVFRNEDLLFRDFKEGFQVEGQVLYYNAERAYEERDYSTAAFLYRKADSMGLRKLNLYLKLASSYMELEEYEEAEKFYLVALAYNYNNFTALSGLHYFYKQQDNEEKKKLYGRRSNMSRFAHPSGYILNKYKINTNYLVEAKILFITFDKDKVNVLIDGLECAGGDVDVISRYPTKEYIEKKGYNFLILDLSNCEDGLFKFARSIKSLDIPSYAIGHLVQRNLFNELDSYDIYTLDLGNYNTRGVVVAVDIRMDRGGS
jgi:DNA-binding response OmpR family regulator